MEKDTSVTPAQFRKRTKSCIRILDKKAASIEDSAERLRAYHAIGLTLLEFVASKPAYGGRQIEQLAMTIGRTSSFLYKTRAFALGYTKRELSELCKHAGQVHWGHLSLLLPIKNKDKRQKLQRRTIREGWSPAELRRVIREKIPKRNEGGRPLRGSENAEACLRQLINVSNTALQYHQGLCTGGDSVLAGLGDLPKAKVTKRLDGEVADAMRTLNELEQTCRQAAQVLRRCRKRLSRA